ncbi:MAG: hypothetical protein ACK6DQ_12050, partial [Planctomycetota bacterium]
MEFLIALTRGVYATAYADSCNAMKRLFWWMLALKKINLLGKLFFRITGLWTFALQTRKLLRFAILGKKCRPNMENAWQISFSKDWPNCKQPKLWL